MKQIAWLIIPLLLCAGSLAFAAYQARVSTALADEVEAQRRISEDLYSALREQSSLLTRSAELLSAIPPEAANLKDIISNQAFELGMTVSDMTPNQEENAGGEMEDQLRVVLRRPAHGQLVRLLTTLENQARWATMKSIHIEVRDDQSDRYDEAVVVLSVPASKG